MLFIIVERFKNGDPVPVYQRFRERGRLAPEGLYYVSSWVDETLTARNHPGHQPRRLAEPRRSSAFNTSWPASNTT
jgi:hypothetical protein